MGVTAHFINQYGKRWHIILGLYKVVSKHSGENIAVVLLALFKEY